MRLSEAIRLGSMWRPQALCAFYEAGKTCAWGAAYEAIGQSVADLEDFGDHNSPLLVARELLDRIYFGTFLDDVVRCCVCGERKSVDDMIPHLNDIHEWTRERIADWVESIERQQGLIPADEQEVVAYVEVESDLERARR